MACSRMSGLDGRHDMGLDAAQTASVFVIASRAGGTIHGLPGKTPFARCRCLCPPAPLAEFPALGAFTPASCRLLGIGGVLMVPFVTFIIASRGVRVHAVKMVSPPRWPPSCSPRSPACARITSAAQCAEIWCSGIAPGIVIGSLAAGASARSRSS